MFNTKLCVNDSMKAAQMGTKYLKLNYSY